MKVTIEVRQEVLDAAIVALRERSEDPRQSDVYRKWHRQAYEELRAVDPDWQQFFDNPPVSSDERK